jgi:CubicO group peptidase (beta-lactamase class C family)
MPLHDGYLDSIASDVQRQLKDAGVAQADIVVEKVGRTSQQKTYLENGEEPSEHTQGNEGTNIYAIGSLTKLLIALLISIIVEKLSKSEKLEDKPYRRLRESYPEPLDTPFTILFNHFSHIKMLSLPKNPTLRNVLLHFNSLPPMNWILLGPDGTSLMSAEEFINVAPRLAEAASKLQEGNIIEYSNGNYILVGLLIQAIAPPEDTLQTLMEKHVFRPLGMNHTYMSRSDLGDVPYTQPHIVSTNGRRALIHEPGFRADAIVNPAMGAFSCPRDIAVLLRSLQVCLHGNESIFKMEIVQLLVQPAGKMDKTGTDRQTLCGIYTNLDSSTPGSKSINRIVSPTKLCSTYRLGRKAGKDGTRVFGYYMTGAVNGYASCFYLMPKYSTFVIVMTNTSGRIDASDHISRLILQEIFDLERTLPQLVSLGANLLNKNSEVQKSDLKAKVDVLEMSSRAAQEGQKVLTEWGKADAQVDVIDLPPLQLDGTYYNKLTNQSIVIQPREGGYTINIKGDGDTTRDLGLHRTGGFTFRIYPLDQDGFTIDRHELYGWKELSFKVDVEKDSYGNNKVVRIKRQGHLLASMTVYDRK